MDLYAAQQPATSTCDHPGGPGAAACCSAAWRRPPGDGRLETAAWVVSDPQCGEVPACEVDLDVVLNDVLSRVPLNSAVPMEVWGA